MLNSERESSYEKRFLVISVEVEKFGSCDISCGVDSAESFT